MICVFYSGIFQIVLAFIIIRLKPTTDILGGISKLDYLMKVSVHQRFTRASQKDDMVFSVQQMTREDFKTLYTKQVLPEGTAEIGATPEDTRSLITQHALSETSSNLNTQSINSAGFSV